MMRQGAMALSLVLAWVVAAGAVEVAVSSMEAGSGEVAALDVTLRSATGIGGLTFELEYPGPPLRLVEVVPGPALEGVRYATYPEHFPSGSGRIRVSGVRATGYAEGGQLLRITFSLPDSGSGDFPVAFVAAGATTTGQERVPVDVQNGGFHVVTAVSETAAALPAHTRLLYNYPNPFNPGTHIPYHLAAAADVVIDLYSVDGRRVRRLALGLQQAGYYDGGSGRAAYWDGRDEGGRPSATGVYICVLKAGAQWHTRKVLLLR